MSTDFLKAALEYAKAGLHVLPLIEGQKRPIHKDWQIIASRDEAIIRKWWTDRPKANIGLHLGKSGILAIDVDPRNKGEASFESLIEEHGNGWLSPVVSMSGRADGGRHYIYAMGTSRDSGYRKLGPGIDTLHGDKYIVLPPSIHPESGKRYGFSSGSLKPDDVCFLPAPPAFVLESRQVSTLDNSKDHPPPIPETEEAIAAVVSALKTINADCDYQEWRNIVFAIKSTRWKCADDLALGWSKSAPGRYDERSMHSLLKSCKENPRREITIGTLFHLAKKCGWKPPRKLFNDAGVFEPLSDSFDDYGDIANGRRFANQYRGQLLQCHALDRWFNWNGARWESCDRGEAMEAAKRIAREAVDDAHKALIEGDTPLAKGNHRQAISVHRNDKRLVAMLNMAKSEPGMSIASPAEFDSDPFRLTVRNGILDLRTGTLLQAHPEMLIHRLAGCEFDRSAQCPKWEKFLYEAMDGNREMVDFLQRVVGYMLTGDVTEEKLFFAYGPGGNGKSVFANVVAALLGEFSETLGPAMLMRDKKGHNQEAIREAARLPGIRVALLNETGVNDLLDDQAVKMMVSREKISARPLYREAFEFSPTFKLLIRGNHQPGVMDHSEGMWRRIVLISFLQRFAGAKGDIPDLDAQIIANELPGVLNWALAGCLEWQRGRLDIPSAVAALTSNYRRETDMMGQWIEEYCVRDSNAETELGILFYSYGQFLKACNANSLTRPTFGRQLGSHGFKHRQSNGRRYWQGLRLRDVADDL